MTVTDNVSLTGIGFESETLPDVGRGSQVEITIAQTACHATVRFSRAGRIPGYSYYGIEVRDRDMIDILQGLVGAHQRRHRHDRPMVDWPTSGSMQKTHPALRPTFDS